MPSASCVLLWNAAEAAASPIAIKMFTEWLDPITSLVYRGTTGDDSKSLSHISIERRSQTSAANTGGERTSPNTTEVFEHV